MYKWCDLLPHIAPAPAGTYAVASASSGQTATVAAPTLSGINITE